LGTVTYVSNGDKNFGKNASRSLEAACPLGWTTTGKLSVRYGSKRIDRTARLRQDKGHEPNGRVSLVA